MPAGSPRPIDYERLFRSSPDSYLVLAADPPDFTVVDASEAFLRLTDIQREHLIDRNIFEVFPEQVDRLADDEDARTIDAVDFERVRRTLQLVLETGTEHHAGTFRYSLPVVQDSDGEDWDGRWTERYWSPAFQPVFGDDGSVDYILLRVEEVTEFIHHRRYSEQRLGGDSALTSRIQLVVADSRRRTYLAELLSTQWEVDAVGSLDAAVEKIRHIPPDLIITELDLPDATGIELLEILQDDAAAGNSASVPLVLLAEDADERTCVRAYESGFEEVICGLASPRELLARVHAQLSAAALRQNLREKSRRQFRQLFMQAPVSISVIKGEDLVYTLSNPAHQQLLGHENLIGKSIYEVFPDEALELLEHFLTRLNRVMETGEPQFVDEFHYRGPGFEGEAREVYLTHAYLPVFDLDGDIEGVAVFGVDVTEQVVARKQIELESQRKDEFLAMLGHEIRNPLTPIAHAAEILSNQVEHPEPERIEWISGVLRRQLDQLADIVNDLLDVARINQGRITLNIGEHRLDEIVSTAVEATKPLVEAGDKHLDVNLPAGQVLIRADGARLTQVLANLLNNAVKYTSQGGHIWLEADVDGDELTIEVRDDGQGISRELLPDVFELFTQAEVSLDRSSGGLGLGLTLVRRLVEMHQGSVEAHSEGPGEGSRFTVRMPVVISAGEEAPQMNEPEADTEDQPLRVLVVDDNVDIAEALAALLEIQGCEVRVAHGGEAGLELASRFRPQVMFLDIGLPSIDGYQVARKLRRTDWGEDIKLIALTGYGQASDRRKAAEAGFDHHLVKPARLEQIREILDGV